MLLVVLEEVVVFLELDDCHSAHCAELLVAGSAFLLELVVDLVGSAFLTLLVVVVVDHSPHCATEAEVDSTLRELLVESFATTAPTRDAVATARAAVRIFPNFPILSHQVCRG